MIIRILSATALALALSTAAQAQDSGQVASTAATASVGTPAVMSGGTYLGLRDSGVPSATALSVAPAVGASAIPAGSGVAAAVAINGLNHAAQVSAAKAASQSTALPIDDRVVTAQPNPEVPYDAPAK